MIAVPRATLTARISAALRARVYWSALSQPGTLLWGQVVLFFVLVASLRLFLVHLYGVDLPYSDQWDSEGWNWLRPYHEGHIDWGILFLPHNEHRIVLVRLLSLALFALNEHQWDNLVAVTFDTIVVAAACSLALRALLMHLAPAMWPLALFLLAACCLPCGYENLLIGFQMQIYCMIVLAVLGVCIAASRRLGVGTFVAIGTITAVSLFTIASGLFTPIAVGVALALRLYVTRTSWQRYAPFAAVLLGAVYAGIVLLVHVTNHDGLRAQDFFEWLDALCAFGSWPLPGSWIAFAILWLPFVLGTALMIRRRDGDAPTIAASALGVWVALQIASIAYGRGHDAAHVHSRYTDILALTVLVNVYFCLHLIRDRSERFGQMARVVTASVWIAAIAGGYAVQGAIGFVDMQLFGQGGQVQADTLRRYVQGSNPTAIDDAQPWNLPYPDKRRLKMMLADKTIREILPASVRPPIWIGTFGGGFSANALPPSVARQGGRGAFGSYAAQTGDENLATLTTGVLHSRFNHLQIAVAGYLGSDGLSLSIDAADRTSTRHVAPASAPGESWATVTVVPPAHDFVLRARDDSRTSWFAFTSPVEIGRLTLWTHRLLDASPVLLFAALLVVYFLVQCCWLRRLYPPRQERATPRSTDAPNA